MSFRREAHVPKGGPDGGNGGRGGDVVLVCDDSLRDLESLRRRSHFRAPRGGHGSGALRHGADGETLCIPVPPGTQVVAEDDGTRHELTAPGQRALVARGGSGGRGNRHFAGPTHQAPRFAERGLGGEERWLTLTLKLIADVGLVGLPNAGKSSLLAALTRARPKVAAYPFTTLAPVLGTLERAERQLVIADIPGLIEGASAGAGLGHEFLAHVERTRVLVHVLELSPLDGSDPVTNHQTVERELAAHDPLLAALPRVLVLSKADLLAEADAQRLLARWRARLGEGTPVVLTSAVTGRGLKELAHTLLAIVPRLCTEEPSSAHPSMGSPSAGSSQADAPSPDQPPADRQRARAAALTGLVADPTLAAHRVFRPAAQRAYHVSRIGPGSFAVSGPGVERLVARYDLDNEEALAHLERRLRGAGVLDALAGAGFVPGDQVEIAGVAFELHPDR